jgi:hypothetical protein
MATKATMRVLMLLLRSEDGTYGATVPRKLLDVGCI